MKKIKQLALVMGLILLAGLSARAQAPSGYLHYEGRGDYSISGRRLSEQELHDLIGDSLYYETYLSAQKQRRAGLPFVIAGAGVMVTGVAVSATYAIVSKQNDPFDDPLFVVGEVIAGVGSLAVGAGLALHFIGNGRLKWIAEDCNRRNGYAADFDFGATRYGIGFTVHF